MSLQAELYEQGRGMAGALIVLGISFVYTNEAWRLAIRLPAEVLIVLVVGGLAVVVPVVRSVGFRSNVSGGAPAFDASPLWVRFGELQFQGLVVAAISLFLLDVLTLQHAPLTAARTLLFFMVPLAFGAALANEFLSGEQDEISESAFPRSLGVFTLGAVFFAAPVAPTEEVTAVAVRASWAKLAGLVCFSLVATYLILHVLEFRGQGERLENRSVAMRLAQTCMVYAVGAVVATAFLLTIGYVGQPPLSGLVRHTVVLSFPSTIGASAARVVLS